MVHLPQEWLPFFLPPPLFFSLSMQCLEFLEKVSWKLSSFFRMCMWLGQIFFFLKFTFLYPYIYLIICIVIPLPPLPPLIKNTNKKNSYQILNPKGIKGLEDPKKASKILIESTELDADLYRLGNTKACVHHTVFT